MESGSTKPVEGLELAELPRAGMGEMSASASPKVSDLHEGVSSRALIHVSGDDPGSKSGDNSSHNSSHKQGGNSGHRQWSTKIVRVEKVDPKTLHPHPKNFRIHPKNQRKAFSQIVDKIGFIACVTANINTRRVINGHLRVEEALRRRQPLIDVEWVDLTEEEERLALVTFDPISEMAEIESPGLASLLQEAESYLGGKSYAIEEIRRELLGEAEEAEGFTAGGHEEEEKAERVAVVVRCSNEIQQRAMIDWATERGLSFKCVVV